jgi:hypothetical protein
MPGQLCWLSNFSSSGKLVLHLRREPHHPWRPYTAYPELCVPDHPIPGGSKGWATSQRLLESGWVIIPTQQAREMIQAPISNSTDRLVSNPMNR